MSLNQPEKQQRTSNEQTASYADDTTNAKFKLHLRAFSLNLLVRFFLQVAQTKLEKFQLSTSGRVLSDKMEDGGYDFRVSSREARKSLSEVSSCLRAEVGEVSQS